MFEQSLIASQKRKQDKARLVWVPVAIVFHVVAFAGVLVAQYWNVSPVAEPPIPVSFMQMAAPPAPPPPPPPPPPPAAPKPVVQQTQVVPTEVVQPVAVPDEIPTALTEPEPEFTGEGVEGGVEGGIPGGVVGGVEGGTGEEILKVGGAITKPEATSKTAPVYTEAARRARIQGVVIVETIIDKQGNVDNVRVLKALPMGLDNAAVEAVKKWKFKPATLNGRPVNVYFVLTVNFQLQ